MALKLLYRIFVHVIMSAYDIIDVPITSYSDDVIGCLSILINLDIFVHPEVVLSYYAVTHLETGVKTYLACSTALEVTERFCLTVCFAGNNFYDRAIQRYQGCL